MPRILIISIVLILISILGGVFFWWPKLSDYLVLRQELERKEIELGQKQEYFQKLNELSAQLKGYSSELTKIDSALPLEPSIPALLGFIKKASLENGLILDNLNLGAFSPSSDNPQIQEIPINLSVSGTYAAFKNLLSTFYKNSRMIEVTGISFSAAETPEEANLYAFDLSLVTHAYSSEEDEEINE